MIKTTKKNIIFSRETWEELKNDFYFNELIEAIEDRETLKKAKAETEYFVDLEEYHKDRMKRNAL
ncbi:MAG: hypothetical protein QG635_266 [Bacteroidota bacterium]|nr:hypothetical protein [Bacteroidota bacterium]